MSLHNLRHLLLVLLLIILSGNISFVRATYLDIPDQETSPISETEDFIVDGIFEAAIDLPRILFLLKRDPNSPALTPTDDSDFPFDIDDILDFGDLFEYGSDFDLDDILDGDFDWGLEFQVNWAYLDTGVSSILFSKETATSFGIEIDPNAQYVDPGVAGEEYFDISEALYIGVADYDDPNPEDESHYQLNGPYRAMIRQHNAEGLLAQPIDLLGMPVMFGKTVVFNTRAPSLLEYFTAQIKEPNDPSIPQADFEISVRFKKYVMPKDPRHIPPLPVLAYNPVIDNITIINGIYSSNGTFLFDTGGMISLISEAQAMNLGLLDPNGSPLREPDFSIPVGGIGESSMVEIPGYEIEHLIVPTLNGYNLVYSNIRLGIQDISVLDENTGKPITIDGIFGNNFIVASMNVATGNIADTPFDYVILDTQNGKLGFDVNELYLLPPSLPTYGDKDNPWLIGDLNRDCCVDISDMEILTSEWLNECNLLNWNCSGADLNSDNMVNFDDYNELVNRM